MIAGAAVGSLAADGGDRFFHLDLTFGIADHVPVADVLNDRTPSSSASWTRCGLPTSFSVRPTTFPESQTPNLSAGDRGRGLECRVQNVADAVGRMVGGLSVTTAPGRTTILLAAGTKSSGEPMHEEVLVESLGQDRYRVAATPGLVLGIAAGDEIRSPGDGRFSVTSRGGNIAVQVYADPDVGADVRPLTRALERLGGRLDGHEKNLWVFTVPSEAGFPAIEEALNAFQADNPGLEWYYGNVYDTDGETLLGW